MASVQNTYRQYGSVRGSPEISPGDTRHLSRWEKTWMHSHREVPVKSRGHAERTLEAWSFLLRRDAELCTGRKWLLGWHCPFLLVLLSLCKWRVLLEMIDLIFITLLENKRPFLYFRWYNLSLDLSLFPSWCFAAWWTASFSINLR